MAYNSTIKQKYSTCDICGDNRPKPTIKGLCQTHYWQSVKLKSAAKERIKDIEPDLQDLISDADAVYSRWLRLSSVDQNGYIRCYTCGWRKHLAHQQCGHYIKRGNLFLRFDPRNTRVQCYDCNITKQGNYIEFTKRLEKENPGIIEILTEESRIIFRPSREEIRGIISNCLNNIDQLKFKK